MTVVRAFVDNRVSIQREGHGRLPPSFPSNGLRHFAYRCRDAEETRHFYEEILGLPLVHLVWADKVPSTGEDCPFVHVVFRMTDGSYIAFFDLGDNVGPKPSPKTPAWVNHALAVSDRDKLRRVKDKLDAAGIPVLGVTDHHFIEPIYFFDSNGIRLELRTDVGINDYKASKLASAYAELDA